MSVISLCVIAHEVFGLNKIMAAALVRELIHDRLMMASVLKLKDRQMKMMGSISFTKGRQHEIILRGDLVCLFKVF